MIRFDGHFEDPPPGIPLAEPLGPSLFASREIAPEKEHDVVVTALLNIALRYTTHTS